MFEHLKGIDPATADPKALAELWGVTLSEAEDQLRILKGTWASDVFVELPSGESVPAAHGPNWQPKP